MNPSRPFSALGGVILVCSATLQADPAQAFGERWRPVEGYAPPQMRDHQRVAPAAFSPPAAMTNHAYQAAGYRFRQPTRYGAARPGYPAPRYGAAMPMPMPNAYSHPIGAGYPPLPGGYLSSGPAYPDFARPSGEVARPWQPQMPWFDGQFAWHPAAQPWAAAPWYGHRPEDRGRIAPHPAGFAPVGPGYGAVYGGWRSVPAAAPTVAGRRYAAAPVYAARQPNGFATWRPVHQSAAAPRPAAWAPLPAGPSPSAWRPQTVVSAGSWAPSRGFRPQAYGRSSAPDQRMVSGGDQRSGRGRDGLPGWVTTYEETDYSVGCAWCGGS